MDAIRRRRLTGGWNRIEGEQATGNGGVEAGERGGIGVRRGPHRERPGAADATKGVLVDVARLVLGEGVRLTGEGEATAKCRRQPVVAE